MKQFKEAYLNIENQIEDNPFYNNAIALHCIIAVATPARTVKVVQNMKSMQAIDSSSQTKLCKQLQGSRLCQPGNFGHLFNTVLGAVRAIFCSKYLKV